MKKTTVVNNLNALLGITEKVEEVKVRTTGRIVGVAEEEIQSFREAQGLIYYLSAPALFTKRICGHCGFPFMVSRKQVAFCSYSCINRSLEKLGITWSKGNNFEALALDREVYNGNEPLWITHSTLTKLKEMVSNIEDLLSNQENGPTSTVTPPSNPVTFSSPVVTESTPPSSPVSTPTGIGKSSTTKTPSIRSRKKKVFIK